MFHLLSQPSTLKTRLGSEIETPPPPPPLAKNERICSEARPSVDPVRKRASRRRDIPKIRSIPGARSRINVMGIWDRTTYTNFLVRSSTLLCVPLLTQSVNRRLRTAPSCKACCQVGREILSFGIFGF